MWTQVGPSNHAVDGIQIPPCEGNFDGENVICAANGWMKEQDHQFFYNGILALGKRRTKCISVAENNVEK